MRKKYLLSPRYTQLVYRIPYEGLVSSADYVPGIKRNEIVYYLSRIVGTYLFSRKIHLRRISRALILNKYSPAHLSGKYDRAFHKFSHMHVNTHFIINNGT